VFRNLHGAAKGALIRAAASTPPLYRVTTVAMNRQRTKQVLFACLLIATTSCSFSKGKQLAESAVVQFHEQYNAGQFHDIYNQADDGLKQHDTEASLVQLFEAVHRKLGTVKWANQTRWYVNATTGGTFVTLSYDTDFSEGKGTEEFAFRINGDKALLYSYHVNSNLLITK